MSDSNSRDDAVERFASFIAALGRGPGRSRPLTRQEAEEAMSLLLAGAVDPRQIGAFLMLLRYRGEDPDEIAGFVSAARTARTGRSLAWCGVKLDWPSYGAGRTRTEPWFLLAALALGQSGIPVLMHGTNAFSDGATVADGLAALNRGRALTDGDVSGGLARDGFAYVPIEVLNPAFAGLLGLRRIFGLRSPMNTVARLLNPADAAAGVDGVFHPPYIDTHLGAAERLGRERLLVLKGGGGEAERNPAKTTEVHIWDRSAGRSVVMVPALHDRADDANAPGLRAVWRGEAHAPAIEARIVGTIALGLMAVAQGGDAEAQAIWEQRRRDT